MEVATSVFALLIASHYSEFVLHSGGRTCEVQMRQVLSIHIFSVLCGKNLNKCVLKSIYRK
jgi:hypothetical protein